MLDRLGLAASSPQQLAELLRTNAELSAYGYANSIQLDVTPVRSRLGASGGWSGSGVRRPQLSASTLFNRDESIGRTSLGAVHSLSYTQKLDGTTEMFFTWSALCHDRFVSSSCQPMMFVSLRRALSSGPGFLAPRGGHIDGVVFKDDRAEGLYTMDLPPIAGAEVVLDNVRYARTDSAGHFRFDGVPIGTHRVEVRYKSDQPTFFTTPSPADVETGSSVHFGVAQSRPTLRGVVLADGGSGLGGVLVHIVNPDRRTTVRTSDDGTFVAEGLLAGDYEVTIDAGSVPPGYSVDTLVPQRVRVEHTAPGRARFVLRPYRSVAGRARLFDRETGQYRALAGATVEILPLRRQAITDAGGQYAFRNLPAGRYTIVLKHDGREHIAAVRVPEGPALVKDIDLAVLPAASTASVRGHASERQAVPGPAGEERPRADEGSSAKAVDSEAPRRQFTIQVAESNSARHARAMVDELKNAGHAAYLERAASDVNGPYRVRVGRFSTVADATLSARTLEKALGWRMSVASISAESVVRGIRPAASDDDAER
jgi:cell division septation protein DedD